MLAKVYKPLLSLSLIVILLFTAILPATAETQLNSTSRKQVLFTKEAIIDETVLYDRAKNGQTDLTADQTFITDLKFPEKLVKDFNIDSYVTTQKLKESQEEGVNGRISKEETYVTTIFTELSPNSYESGGSYLEQPKVDQTASVRCTLTVYFDYRKDTIGSINYYSAKLTSVKAKWDILDSQMKISNGYVRGTAYGFKVTSFDPHQESTLIRHVGTGSGEYRVISSPTSGSGYIYYPSWSDWINVYPLGTQVGGQSDITITRKVTGTSWNFTHLLKVNWTNFPL